VKPTIAPLKPLFIQDIVQGLHSDDHDRYNLAIDNLKDIVMEQDNNDLAVMTPELLQSLFRAQNKFEKGDFLSKKYAGMVAVMVRRPRESIPEIANRLIDSEASLGEKLMLVECI